MPPQIPHDFSRLQPKNCARKRTCDELSIHPRRGARRRLEALSTTPELTAKTPKRQEREIGVSPTATVRVAGTAICELWHVTLCRFPLSQRAQVCSCTLVGRERRAPALASRPNPLLLFWRFGVLAVQNLGAANRGGWLFRRVVQDRRAPRSVPSGARRSCRS